LSWHRRRIPSVLRPGGRLPRSSGHSVVLDCAPEQSRTRARSQEATARRLSGVPIEHLRPCQRHVSGLSAVRETSRPMDAIRNGLARPAIAGTCRQHNRRLGRASAMIVPAARGLRTLPGEASRQPAKRGYAPCCGCIRSPLPSALGYSVRSALQLKNRGPFLVKTAANRVLACHRQRYVVR
jgi:hypothetical protein